MAEPRDETPITIRVLRGVGDVNATAWDACAGDTNPFVSHAFLKALEDSDSVGQGSGWVPHHLVVEDEIGNLAGAAPLYLKGHSYGEYVFDHGWAAAFERAGGSYYPKLQCSVPFTPVTGPRLMVRPKTPEPELTTQALLAGMMQITEKNDLSSLHITFPLRKEWDCCRELGMLARIGRQYHWENRGYGTFDDFLGDLNSRKRKTIRRERRDALATGLTITPLSGDALRERHWDAFYRFYMDTGHRKWGQPYLTREFFSLIGETMAEKIVLMLVEDEGRPVAGALNLKGSDALFGRNWGCVADYPFLHFETCYYQAIDYAIAHGLSRVEAGAQGEHKIQRGYMPTETYSAHYIPHSGFRRAVEDFLNYERDAVQEEIEGLRTLAPFRQNDVDRN